MSALKKPIFKEENSLVQVVISVDDKVLGTVSQNDVERIVRRARHKYMQNAGQFITDELLAKLGRIKLQELK